MILINNKPWLCSLKQGLDKKIIVSLLKNDDSLILMNEWKINRNSNAINCEGIFFTNCSILDRKILDKEYLITFRGEKLELN